MKSDTVYLPVSGKLSFFHPLKTVTRNYRALQEKVLELWRGKVRSCPGHSCQTLFYRNHENGL